MAFLSSKGDSAAKSLSLALGLACLGGVLGIGFARDGPANPSLRSGRLFKDEDSRDDCAFGLTGLSPLMAPNDGTIGMLSFELRSLNGNGSGHSMSSALTEA